MLKRKQSRLLTKSGKGNIDKKLTRRENAFVEEMAQPKVLSQSQAARDAGYAPKSARQAASKNMTKPYIFEGIEKRKAEIHNSPPSHLRQY